MYKPKIDLETLLNQPEPSLIIYDTDYWEGVEEMEREVKKLVDKIFLERERTK